MLIEFKVENFRSFRSEQTFSMLASSDDRLPNNVVESGGLRLLRSALIFGPNASGKSNLYKALTFFREFIWNCNRLNPTQGIPFLSSFKLSKETRQTPSRFELIFLLGEQRFAYGFEVDHSRVYREWLTAWPHGRPATWLERQFRTSDEQYSLTCRGPLRSFQQLLANHTRSNGLALSRGADLNIDALEKVFTWITDNILTIDVAEDPDSIVKVTAARMREDVGLTDRILRFIQYADLGIDGIAVHQLPRPPKEEVEKVLGRFLKPESIQEFSKSWEAEIDKYKIVSEHRSEDGVRQKFDFEEEESFGTQRLFAIVGPLLQIADNGGVLILDELGASLHPLLTRQIIELWQNSALSEKRSQLIATTHETSLFDQELLRRDQFWFADKGTDKASRLWSLCDIADTPRLTTALEKNYLAGRFGATADFGFDTSWLASNYRAKK